MKTLNVLIFVCGFFLLTGCQKEEVMVSKDSAITFEKIGDPRDPSEFMSQDQIEIVQKAFRDMQQGKKLRNPVRKINEPFTRGNSTEEEEGIYGLEDMNCPVTNIDGEYLYICVKMLYYEASKTFSSKITYRLGKGATYKLGFKSSNNTNTYIFGDGTTGRVRYLIEDCAFDVPLTNNPNYTKASVSFILTMQWDERVGYENSCEAIINQKSIKVTYK